MKYAKKHLTNQKSNFATCHFQKTKWSRGAYNYTQKKKSMVKIFLTFEVTIVFIDL